MNDESDERDNEYDRFESLTKKLVGVPKKEMDAQREAQSKKG